MSLKAYVSLIRYLPEASKRFFLYWRFGKNRYALVTKFITFRVLQGLSFMNEVICLLVIKPFHHTISSVYSTPHEKNYVGSFKSLW